MMANDYNPSDESLGCGAILLGIIISLAIWGAILGGCR